MNQNLIMALEIAVGQCELAIDNHATVRRPAQSDCGIGAVEIVFSRDGWTVTCPVKRRDARKNTRWTTAREFADTLDEAIEAFKESLDRWAQVLE